MAKCARWCGSVLFPAYAGLILCIWLTASVRWPFPRIRGGDPSGDWNSGNWNSFSPHTRG